MNTKSKRRFSLFDELDRGLNQLVNEVLQQDSERRGQSPVTVSELEDRYVVECDVPGVLLEDIELRLNDGLLEISGERKSSLPEDAVVTVDERSYERFRRRLQLGRGIVPDSVDAELRNGVLTVTVRKSDDVAARKIVIRQADQAQG